ncbi:MAG: hypothetical protein ACLSE8_00110 [Parasutterella sp.]
MKTCSDQWASDDEIKELRKSFQDAWKAIQDLMDALKPVGDLFLQAFGSVIKVAVETIVLTIGRLLRLSRRSSTLYRIKG